MCKLKPISYVIALLMILLIFTGEGSARTVYKEGEVSGGFVDFLRDNKDGTATVLVRVFDHKDGHYPGLTSSAFKVGLHYPDDPNYTCSACRDTNQR